MLWELSDEPAGTRVADIELALHERHRGPALGGDGARGSGEQRIQLSLGRLCPLPLRAGALFEDLFHVAGRALRPPEIDDRLDLGAADERALDAGRLAGIDGLVQHVPATQKLLRAAGVEDDAAVDLRVHPESEPRRELDLDPPGDESAGRPVECVSSTRLGALSSRRRWSRETWNSRLVIKALIHTLLP